MLPASSEAGISTVSISQLKKRRPRAAQQHVQGRTARSNRPASEPGLPAAHHLSCTQLPGSGRQQATAPPDPGPELSCRQLEENATGMSRGVLAELTRQRVQPLTFPEYGKSRHGPSSPPFRWVSRHCPGVLFSACLVHRPSDEQLMTSLPSSVSDLHKINITPKKSVCVRVCVEG